MPIELTILAWSGVLLIAHLLAAAAPTPIIYGARYGLGERDEQKPPPNQYAARAGRASRNMMETFPVFAVAVLGVAVTNNTGGLAETGAWMYLIGRLAYWPAYVFGIPYIRSAVWSVALFGILLVLSPLLFG